ncbi:MAG TPA: transcriptional regulator [Candidatus Limnocylindria bacterium]|jgi:transcriptional regulator with XRE-family HTH domain|nr:transcriptional regulator [Candidatus Limnocylindria bacterium]
MPPTRFASREGSWAAHDDARSGGEGTLGVFLKDLRCRIDPGARSLGPYVRFPFRHGRPVTQEEVAELVGVSRVWYAMLESNASGRCSPALLDRLANALMATPEERATLFRLALPEVEAARFGRERASVLDAFSVLRSSTKRLWAASSELEALTVASEELAAWFRDASLTHGMRRVEAGQWEWSSVSVDSMGERVREVVREIERSMSSEQIDEFHLYPQLVEAGRVGTAQVYPRNVLRVRLDAFARNDLDVTGFLHARVRSRSGLVGSVNVVHKAGRAYSESDLAVVATLAEITSLALS